MRIAKISCFLILAYVVSGCALTEEIISVDYKAIETARKIPGAENIALALTISDAREADRAKVSAKINGYGMEMAAIRSKRKVVDILNDAIKTELTARGYQLRGNGAPVEVSLVRFYNTYKVGFFAGDAYGEVSFDVKVATAGKKILSEHRVVGKSHDPSIQLATGYNAKKSLENALAKAVSILFADKKFIDALQATFEGDKAKSGKLTS